MCCVINGTVTVEILGVHDDLHPALIRLLMIELQHACVAETVRDAHALKLEVHIADAGRACDFITGYRAGVTAACFAEGIDG